MIFENLTEEEAYLVALLLDESGIDQAEFAMIDETSWDYEKDEKGDGCFRAWPFQVPWFRCKAPKQIDAGCIAEGHKVLTSEGWKPIELVRVGDMVLTHRNRWRPVTDVIPNGRKEVVSVSAPGNALNVRLTPGHQFWSRDARRASKLKDGHKRKKLSDAEWKSSEDWIWNDGSQVMTTHLASPASALPPLDFDRFLKPAYASGRQNLIEDTLNEDWLWLYGLYLAEGSVFDDGQMCRIQWDIHRSEVEDVSSRLDRLGLNFSVSLNKKDLGARVSMHSRPLGEWLVKYGGLGCHNKSIAPWVLGLEEKYRKAVFDGILHGDDHLKNPDGVFELSTTSHDLVLSFRLLAQSLGYTFSAWHSPAPSKPVLIAGREVFSGDSYGVYVKRSSVIIDDGMAWVAPYGFDPAGEANVWDLEVEEDSSFIVEGLVVHNSRSAGKSLSIKLRAFAFPFVAPGEEMVITAPEGNHLDLVTDNVETLYTNCWLAKAMIAPGRGGIKHRPFVINFASGGRIVGRIPQRDGKGVKGIHPLWLEHDEACFPGETLVYTREGYKEIANIKVGDEVLTHKQRWRKVLNVWDRGERDLMEIRGQGHPNMKVTSNHRFWARRVAKWKDSSNQWGVSEFQDYDWIRADELEGCFWASPLGVPEVPLPSRIPRAKTGSSEPIDVLTDDFLWCLGLFVAEGSTSSSYGTGGKLNKSTWSIHVDEVPYVIDRMKRAGLRPFVQPTNGDNCRNVVVSGVELARWLADNCGSGCHNKKIPVWVHSLTEEKRRAFLEGLIYGDGCWTKDPRYAEGRWRLSTTSKALVFDAKVLAHSLGYYTSIYFDQGGQERTIRGKSFMSGPSYELVGAKRGQGFTDEFRLTKVKSVTDLGQRCRVYDIEVDEDHSFVAEGIVVHNSDYPEAGWIELTETVKEQNPNARWRAHGVTRGVGGGFDARISGESEDAGWVVHRLPAMLRPNWTDEERKRKIAEYGSVDNVDYRRNILGLPGDSNSPLFPLWKIFACVDKGKPTEDGRTNDLTYAEDEYYYVKLDDAQLREVGEVGDLLELPLSHRRYSNFWIGMDVGWTTSPSVIVVFAEVRTPKSNEPRLKLLSRIVMYRFDSTAQVDAICEVMEFYRPLAFAMDKGGAGQPLLTQLQDRVKQNPDLRFLLDRIKGYDFGEKIIVGFDEAVKIDPHDPNGWKEAAIRRLVRDASIDAVRSCMGAERMVLPFDKELINELQVVPKNINKAIMDEYGKPVRKTGMHSLDAIRFACLAQEQNVIEQMVATHEQTWTAPQMILL